MLSVISLLVAIALSALISLTKLSPRDGIALSALVSLNEMSKSVILLIPTVKAYTRGLQTFSQNLKVIQQ